MLIGFLFVIALCLTVWAALSLAASPRRREEQEPDYVPLSRSAEAPVWRAGRGPSTGMSTAPAAGTTGAAAAPAYGRTTVTARVKPGAASPQPTKDGRAAQDDRRGAKAKVTQRPNLDDAFERFLDHERKDR